MIEVRTGAVSGADLMIVPVYADRAVPEGIDYDINIDSLTDLLDARDFTGKHGQTVFVQTPDGPTAEALLVGLGDDVDIETVRRAAAVAARAAKR